MTALLIYFMLNSAGQWEYLTMERVPDIEYCEQVARNVAKAHKSQPGNFRIVCTDEKGFEL